MAQNLMTGTPAREAGYEMVQYVAGRVTAVAAGTSINKKIGVIPAGSVLLSIISRVAVAITGGTPVLSLGTASGGTQIQGTLAEAQGSEQVFPAAAFANPTTADIEVWANITGGATAGDAYLVVLFVKPLA